MSAAEEKNIKAAGEKALKRMRVASGQGGGNKSLLGGSSVVPGRASTINGARSAIGGARTNVSRRSAGATSFAHGCSSHLTAALVQAQHPASHQVSCSHPFRVSSLGILMQRSRRRSTGQMLRKYGLGFNRALGVVSDIVTLVLHAESHSWFSDTFRCLGNLAANRRHMDTLERFLVEKSVLEIH